MIHISLDEDGNAEKYNTYGADAVTGSVDFVSHLGMTCSLRGSSD